MSLPDPLLVFGPRSTDYDFGPVHPLTPRRFWTGISLLETLGAVPGLAPEPASDEELALVHDRAYIEHVKRCGSDPVGAWGMGIGPGDTPAFGGMHEASAAVAGGSLRAMEAILGGEIQHAFHPGGGLHHAMRARASGFCVYDDPALAVARARHDGLRVLYVDLDVHHGDGVQAIHWDDPGVMTVSIHESGSTLFPGTGFQDELGGLGAEGTAVNIPLDPGTGEIGWVEALEIALPPLAEAFRPAIVVSQHGADSHAYDPLAHLMVTTTAMGRAARLVDSLAHRHAGGRWLATGGGGYDVYRVVPRMWAHVWLAQTHATPLGELSPEWRERWAADAERYGQSPIPSTLDDPENAGLPYRDAQERADRRAAEIARASVERALEALRRREG
ncbi:MAG TPA: acetoin utilization protein AcuC [Candidatus Binatia bacterium]|nr:acetoin utilization protein AcuC [Candidatus Binatia bacterium]